MNKTIEVYQESSKSFSMTLTNVGVAFPLAGYTCRFVVQDRFYEETLIDKESTDITDNKVVFSLTSEDTDLDQGNYTYEIHISKDETSKTVAQGVFSVINSLVANISEGS